MYKTGVVISLCDRNKRLLHCGNKALVSICTGFRYKRVKRLWPQSVYYIILLLSIILLYVRSFAHIAGTKTTQHPCLVNSVQLLDFPSHLETATSQSGTTVVTIASNHPPNKS